MWKTCYTGPMRKKQSRQFDRLPRNQRGKDYTMLSAQENWQGEQYLPARPQPNRWGSIPIAGNTAPRLLLVVCGLSASSKTRLCSRVGRGVYHQLFQHFQQSCKWEPAPGVPSSLHVPILLTSGPMEDTSRGTALRLLPGKHMAHLTWQRRQASQPGKQREALPASWP